MFELNCPDFVWLNKTQNSFSCFFTAFTNYDGLSLVISLNGSTTNRTITSTLYNYAISTLTFTGIPEFTTSGSYISTVTAKIFSLGFTTSKQIYC